MDTIATTITLDVSDFSAEEWELVASYVMRDSFDPGQTEPWGEINRLIERKLGDLPIRRGDKIVVSWLTPDDDPNVLVFFVSHADPLTLKIRHVDDDGHDVVPFGLPSRDFTIGHWDTGVAPMNTFYVDTDFDRRVTVDDLYTVPITISLGNAGNEAITMPGDDEVITTALVLPVRLDDTVWYIIGYVSHDRAVTVDDGENFLRLLRRDPVIGQGHENVQDHHLGVAANGRVIGVGRIPVIPTDDDDGEIADIDNVE